MMNWFTKAAAKVGLKYGLAGGVVAIVLFLALYSLQENPLSSIRLFDFILIPLFLGFALWEARQFAFGGYISYSQAMTLGAICTLSLALVSGVFIFLFLEMGNEHLLTQYQQEGLAILQGGNAEVEWSELGTAEHQEAIEKVANTTTYQVATDDFLKKALIGLFLSSLFSVFLKRSPPKTS